MPHYRKRYLQVRLQKALKYSAIVGVLGQRQVGKTTLLEGNSSEYVSLDRERFRLLADSDPEAFIEGHKSPFGIDEAQLSAGLFPALKEYVRTRKKPGQFLLTGSVRFTSKQTIRESLTGRIVSLELLPFTLRESREAPLPDFLRKILSERNENALGDHFAHPYSPDMFVSYLRTGGLPGICFFREDSIRFDKFEAHLDTILNRDIRLIYPTTLLYTSLRRLLVYLARNQGIPFQLVAAARESQISTVTLPKVLFAFEALFLIRPVEIRGIRKTTYFLEDQGMATWLKGSNVFDSLDLIRGLYANLRQEIWYRPERNGRLFQWRTRNGVEVPLVFESTDGTLGILPTIDTVPTPKIVGSATSFLKKFPKAKAIIAYSGKDVRFQKPNLIWIPYWLLL